MPLAAKNNLDELYARHRLLEEAALRLEEQSDQLGDDAADLDRRYILDVQSSALRAEASKLSATISDILERDLQR
jgi:hypothetical protein